MMRACVRFYKRVPCCILIQTQDNNDSAQKRKCRQWNHTKSAATVKFLYELRHWEILFELSNVFHCVRLKSHCIPPSLGNAHDNYCLFFSKRRWRKNCLFPPSATCKSAHFLFPVICFNIQFESFVYFSPFFTGSDLLMCPLHATSSHACDMYLENNLIKRIIYVFVCLEKNLVCFEGWRCAHRFVKRSTEREYSV